MLGLDCCTQAFYSCGKWGLLSSCPVQTSPRSGFSCWGAQAVGTRASVAVAVGLVALWHVWSSWTRDWTCIASPLLAGRFLTTGPPGKSSLPLFLKSLLDSLWFSTITPQTTYQVFCIFFTDCKVRESLGKFISLWRKRCCHVKEQSIPDALRREKRCA